MQIQISRKQEGKKYLDLFVWDSTVAMSEGWGGWNSNDVTTGA